MTHEAWRSELQGGAQQTPEQRNDTKMYIVPDRRRKFSGATIIESREISRDWHAEMLKEDERGRGGLGLCSPKSSDLGASARRSSGTK
jgi:hypothetical protein